MVDLLEQGQIFAGRYRIERFLAKGGFGAVYVAEQIETELRVAVKVLWPQVLQSEAAVAKFKLEARIAGRVGSEHIVQVFDAGFDDKTGMPFLVMELLQGMELEEFVLQNGALPPAQAVLYLAQVASALDKAHGYVNKDGEPQPIIHRDLKPENLFLCQRESGDPIIKVLDFGIAKVLSQSTQVSQEIKGTPLYMAFEQASGSAVSPRTDIWALGLIAFFVLTGRSYWRSGNSGDSTLVQLFSEVLTLPIDPPSVRAREVQGLAALPAGFDAWFSRCVNRDPNQRFASAGECVRSLAVVFGLPSVGGLSRAVGEDALGATSFVPSSDSLGMPSSITQPSAVAPGHGSTTGALSIASERPAGVRRRNVWPLLAIGAACLTGGAVVVVFLAMRQPTTLDDLASASVSNEVTSKQSEDALVLAATTTASPSSPTVTASSVRVDIAATAPVHSSTDKSDAEARSPETGASRSAPALSQESTLAPRGPSQKKKAQSDQPTPPSKGGGLYDKR